MSSVYRVGEFAKKVGRSASTIREWDAGRKLTARQSPSGQRYFDDAEVRRIMQPGFDDSARPISNPTNRQQRPVKYLKVQ